MTIITEHTVRNEIAELHRDLRKRHGSGGWRAVGDALGVSGAYARQLANGDRPITPAIVEAWLVATHRKPKIVPVLACPVHNVAHCYDCNGYDNPVVTVRQRQPKRERRRTSIEVAPDTGALFRDLRGDMSNDEFLRRLLEAKAAS